MNRRDFTRNVARYGIGGALGALVGIKRLKGTDAQTDSTGCWQTIQPVSACTSRYQWCCSDGTCGQWQYYSHNNCLFFHLNAHCCG